MSVGATPLLKLKLERADVIALVRQDPLLKGSAWLAALGERRDPVLKAGVGQRYPDRVMLFQQGDPGDSLFFVLAGEVRLYERAGTEAVELGNVRQGEVVGETEVLAGAGPRRLTALAVGAVDVVELPRLTLLAPGGSLSPPVREYLQAVELKRRAIVTAMTDFLNRW